ncbi:hypothetical protein T484DRAFT_1856910 [Baffinella frigidus]|nr:hypothetical protein T484DRAFT_1856910 [Cryptophyta sp. CCMP2293]
MWIRSGAGACLRAHSLSSSASSQRRLLEEEEGGICEGCGLNCTDLLAVIRATPQEGRATAILKAVPAFASSPASLRRLVTDPVAGSLWYADHDSLKDSLSLP